MPRRRPPQSRPPEAAAPADDDSLEGIPAAPTRERLAKFLAHAGIASRRACEELILEGRVMVDGATCKEVGATVDPTMQEVRIDDQVLRPEPKQYWLLNKPKGVLCTARDDRGRQTVMDLLPRHRGRLYPVGRLDEDSTGLILLTNDGELALRLTHPRFEAPKTYLCLVAGSVQHEAMEQLRHGVRLAEGVARVAGIRRIGTQGQATRMEIVLREGKNREIRRVFAKVGHKVMSLHRVAIGPVKIRKLAIGEARPATSEELLMLRQQAGLAKGLPPAADGAAPPAKKRFRPRPAAFDPSKPKRRPGKPDPALAPRPRRPPGPNAGPPRGRKPGPPGPNAGPPRGRKPGPPRGRKPGPPRGRKPG